MRGITCMHGRGERCGVHLVAADDDGLSEAYLAHVRDAHRDLEATEQQVRDDILVEAYDVAGPTTAGGER